MNKRIKRDVLLLAFAVLSGVSAYKFGSAVESGSELRINSEHVMMRLEKDPEQIDSYKEVEKLHREGSAVEFIGTLGAVTFGCFSLTAGGIAVADIVQQMSDNKADKDDHDNNMGA